MDAKPPKTIEIEQSRIACDGGGEALGHPKVYLEIGAEGTVDCPYCGRHYVLKSGAEAH
jgi:uncharacterized Zn-finger protein